MAVDLKSSIESLREEIDQLRIELAISKEPWPPMHVKEEDFNQELLELHELKKEELTEKWTQICGSLDDLLMDLEDSDEPQMVKKDSTPSLPSEEKVIHKLPSEQGAMHQWMADGKEYRLLTKEELEENRERHERRIANYRKQFKMFQQRRREELSQTNTPDPSLTSTPVMQGMRENTQGAAWMCAFIGDSRDMSNDETSPAVFQL